MKKTPKIIIYQSKNGAIELQGDLTEETIWASQKQLAQVFGVNVRTINEHIKSIFRTKELEEKSTIRNFQIVQQEGRKRVSRTIKHYNLDMIISVGYRVNSKTATKFRQWATKTLRSHIIDGYTINRKRIAQNHRKFLEAVEEVKKLLPGGEVDAQSALELAKMFASTWLSLDAYDKADFPKKGATKTQVRFTAEELTQALIDLKQELITKKEASDLFGLEKQGGSISGIVGNVFQSFDGKDLYPSIEQKAAHILYFFVKNHPFTDGNKRSGAFAFIWFLQKAKILKSSRLTPAALTALTLLVAESRPRDKQRIIGVIVMMLS